jgi:DivIVA domain-containing protein
MMKDMEGAGPERSRLTPVDVQQVQFRRARIRGGYSEQEVDDFLDRISEDLAAYLEENERLRGQIRRTPTSQMAGAGDAAEASRAAAELKERAQREADAIVREAGARAQAILREAQGREGGAPATPAGPPADATRIAPFINRERQFLQDLAKIIQGHAETVKQMVNDARAAPPAESARTRAPAQEPFGPPGESAGRDIDGTDDAEAAAAGTAEADSVVGAQPDDDPSVVRAGAEVPEAADGATRSPAVAAAGSEAAVIEVPEAEGPAAGSEPGGGGEEQGRPGVPAGVADWEASEPEDGDGPDLPRVPVPPGEIGAAGPGASLGFGERAARQPAPAPAQTATELDDEEDDGDGSRELRELRDREASLRELFWGED